MDEKRSPLTSGTLLLSPPSGIANRHRSIGRSPSDKFLRPGPSADIGCGSGRDTAWLVQNGFAAVGYDPSEGLLAQARRLHPGVDFPPRQSARARWRRDASLVNVLCETGPIMHLEPVVIPCSGAQAYYRSSNPERHALSDLALDR